MRMSNLHHFTEHHRYCVSREFGLSHVDSRMLGSVYQPMVGVLRSAYTGCCLSIFLLNRSATLLWSSSAGCL